MKYTKSFFIVLGIIFLATPSLLLASEKKEEAKTDKKADVKQEGGGEFAKHDALMEQLYSQIFSLEKNIKELLEEKNKTKDDEKVQEIIAEIHKSLKERKEIIRRYNKEYHIVRYQYPQKARAVTTKYKRFEESNVKEFEDKINQELSESYQNIKKKYGN